jgi:acylphosphatase
MIKVHIFISGRVQKVGFRFFTRQKAQRLGLTGWVRNRTDGRVEVEAIGKKEKIDQFFDWLHQGSPLSRVEDVEVTDRKKINKNLFSGFEIKATN